MCGGYGGRVKLKFDDMMTWWKITGRYIYFWGGLWYNLIIR